MRIRTAMNHAKRYTDRVRAIYFNARLSGSTHDAILVELGKLYSDSAWKRCPAWVRADATRLSQDLSRRLYQPDLHAGELERLLAQARAGEQTKPVAYLRWQLRLASTGEHLTSSEISERNLWQSGIEGAHIWNHKPQGEPFSPWRSATTS